MSDFSKDDIRRILTETPVILVSIMASEATGKKYLSVGVLNDYR
jgi:hypothetical protein